MGNRNGNSNMPNTDMGKRQSTNRCGLFQLHAQKSLHANAEQRQQLGRQQQQ